MTKRLEIVTSRLFCECIKGRIPTRLGKWLTPSEMGVYAHISRCPTKALAFAIRDVLFCLGITVLLRHTKVHNVYHLSRHLAVPITRIDRHQLTVGHFGPRSAHKKVIRFNIAIDEILVVDRLHTRDLTTA